MNTGKLSLHGSRVCMALNGTCRRHVTRCWSCHQRCWCLPSTCCVWRGGVVFVLGWILCMFVCVFWRKGSGEGLCFEFGSEVKWVWVKSWVQWAEPSSVGGESRVPSWHKVAWKSSCLSSGWLCFRVEYDRPTKISLIVFSVISVAKYIHNGNKCFQFNIISSFKYQIFFYTTGLNTQKKLSSKIVSVIYWEVFPWLVLSFGRTCAHCFFTFWNN